MITTKKGASRIADSGLWAQYGCVGAKEPGVVGLFSGGWRVRDVEEWERFGVVGRRDLRENPGPKTVVEAVAVSQVLRKGLQSFAFAECFWVTKNADKARLQSLPEIQGHARYTFLEAKHPWGADLAALGPYKIELEYPERFQQTISTFGSQADL